MIPTILQAGAAVSASEQAVLSTTRVKAGHIFHVLSIAAMDLTTAIATFIEIGILDGTKEIPIDATPGNFPANTSHTVYWPCVLREGQRVYAKFNTPTAGDYIVLYAHGFYERVDHDHP